VTHLLPMLECLCAWGAAARDRIARLGAEAPRLLVTFQGYELYSNYAHAIGLRERLYHRIAEFVERSDYPAIAVSEDYARRVTEDIGLPPASMRAIPPGVPPAARMSRDKAFSIISGRFGAFRPELPLVTYLGRRDVEKGLDLLLYAAAILRRRGMKFQLALCGPTLFGSDYVEVCRRLAEDLRCPVMWRGRVPEDVRSALFSASRCVVYPSVHREPFGMVAAEVLAHGTPVVVPDFGGVASAIEAEGLVGGLRFRVWDSGDLAEQVSRLLSDDALWQELSTSGPRIAAYFSVANLADRVLALLGLAAQAKSAPHDAAMQPAMPRAE
jgi:glycosyltransferase involved in cell wall biosynthesis